MTAGVITKHMQQVEKIREFLTGQMLLTLLDATSLLIVVPLLFMYRTRAGGPVLCFSAFTACVIAALIPIYRRRLRLLYQAEAQRQAFLVETIHGMETVKALATEPLRRREWDFALRTGGRVALPGRPYLDRSSVADRPASEAAYGRCYRVRRRTCIRRPPFRGCADCV